MYSKIMIDVSPAEVSSRDRIKQISTHMYGLVGSITGDKVHRSYASLKADHIIDHKTITDVQKDKIDYIKRNYTPEEVVASVLEHPPTVFVDVGDESMEIEAIRPKKPVTRTPPSPFDKEIARRNILIDRDIYGEPTTTLLENYVNVCKNYLELPVINDDFADHNQRRDWERGIQEVFNVMGREWNEAFSNFWDFSRYAKNKQTPIINYAEVILDMPNINLPERLQVKFQEIAAKMRNGREIFLQGDMRGINIIAGECARVSTLFTHEQLEMDKLVSEMFNSLASSVTSRYPISIPSESGRTIKLLPKEIELMKFIRENTNATDLSYFILENPPTITAKLGDPLNIEKIHTQRVSSIAPTYQEKEIAKKFFALPLDSIKSNESYVRKVLDIVKSYLVLPRRKDSFTDHNQRQLWQKGVGELLGMISMSDPQRQDKNDWNWIFNDIWNKNRYTTNARSRVITGVQELMTTGLPQKVKTELNKSLVRLNEAQQLIGDDKLDLATDTISDECAKVVSIFSN